MSATDMTSVATGHNPVNAPGIPQDLRNTPRWLLWRAEDRKGKPTKVPISPSGRPIDANDPKNWRAFDVVLADYQGGRGRASGVGFAFCDDDDLTFVDLDHCRDEDGSPTYDAQWKFAQLDSYAEWSPSGEGIHIYLRGDVPDNVKTKSVEIYVRGRFATVTGQHVEDTPESVNRRPRQVQALYDDIAPKPKGQISNLLPAPPTLPLEISDADLVEKALAASNGDRFRELWRGDTSGYPSQSEADLALTSRIVWWTNGDEARTDRLFRQSGLYRDKWDQRRGRTTYGERTIARALSDFKGGYTGGPVTPHSGTKDAETLTVPRAEYDALRERVRELEAERFKIHCLIGKKGLTAGEKLTAIALVALHDLARRQGQVDEDGRSRTYAGTLAAATAQTEGTVGKHLATFAKAKVVDKAFKTEVIKTVDRDGVIHENCAKVNWCKLDGPTPALALDRFVSIDVDELAKPKRGGDRERRCPKHPDALLVHREVWTCSECGDVVDEAESFAKPDSLEGADIKFDTRPPDQDEDSGTYAVASTLYPDSLERGNHHGDDRDSLPPTDPPPKLCIDCGAPLSPPRWLRCERCVERPKGGAA